MSDVLNSPVLVLNKGWTPIHIKSAKEAICDVVSECAKIIDTEDEFLTMYDWVDWAELAPSENSKIVRTSKKSIRIPEVIVLTDYSEVPELEIRLTRKNLLLRDNYSCQYCGKKVTYNDFTVDHIIPRSKGGLNAWENFVVACQPCNSRKKDRTPKEAGIVLKTKPIKPKWYPLASRYTMHSPNSWHKFLPSNKVPAMA